METLTRSKYVCLTSAQYHLLKNWNMKNSDSHFSKITNSKCSRFTLFMKIVLWNVSNSHFLKKRTANVSDSHYLKIWNYKMFPIRTFCKNNYHCFRFALFEKVKYEMFPIRTFCKNQIWNVYDSHFLWKKNSAARLDPWDILLKAACWFSFIFSFFLIFTFPFYNFVFLILLSFLFFFVLLYALSFVFLGFSLPSR